METLQAIKTRRSIRAFTKKKVSDNKIKKIIEAGMRAPSSKNSRPWHFIVLKGKKKDKLIDVVEKVYYKVKEPKWVIGAKSTYLYSCSFIRNAPVLILAFNKTPFSGGEKALLKKCTYDNFTAWTVEIESISAAMQNMLLAINALGLGGVWVSDLHIARKEIKKFTKCNYDYVAAIVLGCPKH